MTRQKAVSIALAMRPCELSEDTLTYFVNELEAELATEVRGEAAEDVTTLDGLAVPAPYDRVYWTYLVSLIDLATGNTVSYALSRALFEQAHDAYARWYQRTGGGV